MSRQPLYWGIGLVLGALLLGGVAVAAWPAGVGAWGWHGGMMSGLWGGAGGLTMILGMLAMAAFWVGIVLLAVWGFRSIVTPGGLGTGQASPLEVAKARYARGEITKAEFEEIRKTLE